MNGGGGSIASGTDVALSNPSTGQVLTYDATTTKWKNMAASQSQGAAVYVEDYGAVGNGSTDDTAAINNAIVAAVSTAQANGSYYAEVRFQAKTYSIAGALKQGGATKGNAQIALPVIGAGSPSMTLVLRSASGPGAAPNPYFGQTVAGVGGTILQTTLTGQIYSGTYGAPAVIGGPTPEQGYGYTSNVWNNMLVVIDNLTVMTQFESGAGTMTGVHLGGTSKAYIESLSCIASATISQFSNTANKPVNFWSNGLYMPQDNNNDNSYIGTYSAYGFYRGIFGGEHLTAQRIATIYCWIGMSMHAQAGHGWTVLNASVEACQIGFTQESGGGGGYKPVFIGLLDCENISFYSGGGYHVSDYSDSMAGTIYVNDNIVGPAGIAVNSAANIEVLAANQKRGFVTAPNLPATATPFKNPFWRHASVTVSGTLTDIKVDGHSIGQTVGTVTVPSGKLIELAYSGAAPTWVWILH